jgi:hypothetical protein
MDFKKETVSWALSESITYILSLISIMLFIVLLKKFIDWEIDWESFRIAVALFFVSGYVSYRKEGAKALKALNKQVETKKEEE